MFALASLRPLTADLPPIVILSSLDIGGAGIAALRLHQGLVAAGANVKMVVLSKTSSDAKVGELKVGDGSLWKQAVAAWAQVARDYPASAAWQEPFTTVAAPFNVAELDLVQNAGLVNLHWCAGMLPWPKTGAGLQGKPLVWTLHDMHPFTGCCHYVGTCEKWRREGCQKCPRMGPSNSGEDLAAACFAAKQAGYAGLHLHLVTPSVWLGECAGQSVLLGKFPRSVIPYGFPLQELRPGDRAAARAALGLPTNRKIILFGASLCGCQRKGMHLLVTALTRLAQKWPGEPPALAVFGNPSGMPAMPPGFECHPLGRLNGNAALSRAYSAADVFVGPSMEEAFATFLLRRKPAAPPASASPSAGCPTSSPTHPLTAWRNLSTLTTSPTKSSKCCKRARKKRPLSARIAASTRRRLTTNTSRRRRICGCTANCWACPPSRQPRAHRQGARPLRRTNIRLIFSACSSFVIGCIPC